LVDVTHARVPSGDNDKPLQFGAENPPNTVAVLFDGVA
jgi:hypothetical protein